MSLNGVRVTVVDAPRRQQARSAEEWLVPARVPRVPMFFAASLATPLAPLSVAVPSLVPTLAAPSVPAAAAASLPPLPLPRAFAAAPAVVVPAVSVSFSAPSAIAAPLPVTIRVSGRVPVAISVPVPVPVPV
eukprot:CAMPEP_0198681012 /NCGR_PEP_ID=MMETSP1468-20131203/5991_1 /TAXON_ID=1461545 /ORGANISM="Mantoniella sp, Strain CCMP1436" /LENGTH=131 /DNA_ID=CAMNT_0044422127 /DNA_START=296 /DNA_END=688 /DNA_ORIENTATION=+